MHSLSYELRPLRTIQKSFYGKAHVSFLREDNGDEFYELLSYETHVLSVYVPHGCPVYAKKLWCGYSATTLRHVNELLMQLDFPKLTAKEWRAMEVGKFYHTDEIPALFV